MKSKSAAPDFPWMSAFKAARDASLCTTSAVTMAGSVSSGAGAFAGAPFVPGSATVRMKSPRARTVSSALPNRGSDLPTIARRPARLAGEARAAVTSTKTLPPASCMGAAAVSCQKETPNGFMGSVIICW